MHQWWRRAARGIEGVSECLRGKVGVRRGGGEGDGGAWCVGLAWNRGENGSDVHFVHNDAKGRAVTQNRFAVVSNAHGDEIGAGPLPFGRRPGHGSIVRINSDSGGRRGIEAVGQRLRGRIGIGGAARDSQQRAFADVAIGDARENGRVVDFVDMHIKGARGAEVRGAVIGDAHGNGVITRAVGFGGEPTQDAIGRVDKHAGGRARFQGVGQSLAGIRIVRGDGEAQQTAFVHIFVGDESDEGGDSTMREQSSGRAAWGS